MTSRDKKIFTVLGEFKVVDGRKKFIPKSLGHLKSMVDTVPTGKRIICTFSERASTLSEQQRDYFFALVKYLCDYTGYTKDDMYQVLIKEKFGVEMKSWRGKTYEVRRSVSDSSGMSVSDMNELIEHTLNACRELDITVPTKEELGYISNYGPKTLQATH